MKILALHRYVIGAYAVVLLAGCSSSAGIVQSAAVQQQVQAIRGGVNSDAPLSSFEYVFKGGSDGAEPQAPVIRYNGMLYGTTSAGGNGGCGSNVGCGTVFAINSASGAETVLYRFQGGQDGADSVAGLVALNGTLYGTTYQGGSPGCLETGVAGCGTVFAVNPTTGEENVIYRFQGGRDGRYPSANLIVVNGVLYGTTLFGGNTHCKGFGCGTIFSIAPATGHETVLHRFQGYGAAALPEAGLLALNNTLYGTTTAGIKDATLFAFDMMTHKSKILHQFLGHYGGRRDGGFPLANVIAVNSVLYGTTAEGGTGGKGTVFRYDLSSNQYKVVCDFTNYNHASPQAPLLNVKGALYGTTYSGPRVGGGTIFKFTPSHVQEKTVYIFKGSGNGAGPQAGLITEGHSAKPSRVFFGTTRFGGVGNGTAFGITLSSNP
jgi:uncharacterized repeat protein (TIGR03803 family)